MIIHNSEMYDTFTDPPEDEGAGALVWLVAILVLAGLALMCPATKADAQTVLFQHDLAGFRREVVGVPVPVDPDNNPATVDWLVRFADEVPRFPSPIPPLQPFVSVVMRANPAGGNFCAGRPFLRSTETHPEVVVTPRTATWREGTVLHHVALDVPRCEP